MGKLSRNLDYSGIDSNYNVVRLYFNAVQNCFVKAEANYKTKSHYLEHYIFLLLGMGIFGKFNQYPLRWSDAYSFENDYAANIALNPFQSFFSTLEFRHVSYDINAVKKAYPLMADYLGVNNPDSNKLNFQRVIIAPDPTHINQPNIVIVICESFSGFKSSMYGNPLNTTPFFNQLCKQGIFFNRCFTPSFGTARGVWATITGIPDVDFINTSSRNPLAVDQHTIINDFITTIKCILLVEAQAGLISEDYLPTT